MALDDPLVRVSGVGIRREHGELRAGETGPVKADYRVLDARMTPPEAFRAVCAACVQHLESNRYGTLSGEDPEYLHQMRVALRRLRTAFGIFADELPRAVVADMLAELRWLRRALGPARDWDVFIAGTLRPALAHHPRHAGLRAFRAACEELSGRAKAAAQRALESRRYYALMRSLRALSYGDAPRPAGAARAPAMARHARAAVAALIDRARKRGRRLMRQDAAELHRLRKAVRRLRYGLLFLAPLLPAKRVRPLAGAVEALQETLGALNDCAAGKELIARAHAEAGGGQRRKARKLLARRLKAARAARRGELEAQWEVFRAYGWSLRISG